MIIPNSKRKKALIVVDIQQGFIKKWDIKSLRKNIEILFENQKYDLYVEATFFAPKGSIWDKQTGWTFPYEKSVPWMRELLKGKNTIQVKKKTKSVFKGNIDIEKHFKKYKIQEVHLIGFDSNDCVLTTAQESFDRGYFTYVIEECTGSSAGKKMYQQAISILRDVELTNRSKLITSKKIV